MTDPSLSLQIAARIRLVTTPAVTALVAANRILDQHARPASFPCIIIGTAQTIRESLTLSRSHLRITFDLHIWTDGSGLEATKNIAGVVVPALKQRPVIEGLRVIDWTVKSVRYLRDPAAIGHGVVTIEALVEEPAQ